MDAKLIAVIKQMKEEMEAQSQLMSKLLPSCEYTLPVPVIRTSSLVTTRLDSVFA